MILGGGGKVRQRGMQGWSRGECVGGGVSTGRFVVRGCCFVLLNVSSAARPLFFFLLWREMHGMACGLPWCVWSGQRSWIIRSERQVSMHSFNNMSVCFHEKCMYAPSQSLSTPLPNRQIHPFLPLPCVCVWFSPPQRVVTRAEMSVVLRSLPPAA